MGNTISELSDFLSSSDSVSTRSIVALPREATLRILRYCKTADLVHWQTVSHEWEELCIAATWKLPQEWTSKMNDELLGLFYNLTTLHLDDNKGISDAGISRLVHLQHLKIVGSTMISGSGLVGLPLKSLQLVNTNRAENILASCSPVSLVSLHLADVPSFSEILLQKFSCLTYLHLERLEGDVSDETIMFFPHLKRLHLIEQDIVTDKALSTLTDLVELDYRNIYGDTSGITDAGLVNLTNLTNLNLHQNYSQDITDKSIAVLTNLIRLYIEPYRNPMITDKSLSLLVNLKSLNSHYLSDEERPPRLQCLKPANLRSSAGSVGTAGAAAGGGSGSGSGSGGGSIGTAATAAAVGSGQTASSPASPAAIRTRPTTNLRSPASSPSFPRTPKEMSEARRKMMEKKRNTDNEDSEFSDLPGVLDITTNQESSSSDCNQQ
eukprot:TRINITY_DN2361_c0_g1_i2.p1 TRINITY_DN2361_c0_g1~~TRINITY_DN2361_c0_g1_i2.p1  ORF type:complete len:437 (+),score=84.31 TRINITY_DN2361_c0_g1_i2:80-1390(+)